MDLLVLGVFLIVYLGMLLGELPGLALDRTGVALLGALALVAAGRLTPAGAWEAIDVPTIALLFGLMVLSAQLRLGGFYTWVTRRVVAAPLSPSRLLAAVVVVAGVLSAVLANDIVCLAMAPLVVEGCARRGLRPVPFLLALACASNVGSAATLIGNPQNMLIGQALRLSFAAFLMDAAVPALVGLAVVWWWIQWSVGGAWEGKTAPPEIAAPAFDAWQTAKGLILVGLLVIGFLFAPVPREVLALATAALVLSSRRMASREVIGLVDWHLLVLFAGLFIVNKAFADAGFPARLAGSLQSGGVHLEDVRWLFPATLVLSNLVSNVPAVMLLLPYATHPLAGPALALSSTLAGNLLIVGSIANIIVVDQAAACGVRIGWREHARVGLPVTVLTVVLAAAWLLIRSR